MAALTFALPVAAIRLVALVAGDPTEVPWSIVLIDQNSNELTVSAPTPGGSKDDLAAFADQILKTVL